MGIVDIAIAVFLGELAMSLATWCVILGIKFVRAYRARSAYDAATERLRKLSEEAFARQTVREDHDAGLD